MTRRSPELVRAAGEPPNPQQVEDSDTTNGQLRQVSRVLNYTPEGGLQYPMHVVESWIVVSWSHGGCMPVSLIRLR